MTRDRDDADRIEDAPPYDAALAEWIALHGCAWRARLRAAWMHAAYPGVSAETAAALQRLRNTVGSALFRRS